MSNVDLEAPPEGRQASNAGDCGRETRPLLSEPEMLREEEEFLWPKGRPNFCAGLALSGGGIRAATVALGVLQGLAAGGMLARFHYLSTVSGGGYIGSSLSWFWSKRRVDEESALPALKGVAQGLRPRQFGAAAADFPFQEPCDEPTDVQQQAIANLAFLRNHGSYLTSGDGIGFAGLIVAVLRTVVLSLAVWLPLLVLLFGIFELIDYSLIPAGEYEDCTAGASVASDLLKPLRCRPSFRFVVIVAGILVLGFFAGVILFSFLGRRQLDSSVRSTIPQRRNRRIAGYLLGFVAIFAFVIAQYSGLESLHPAMGVELALLPLLGIACFMMGMAEFFRPANRGYFLRRSFERLSSKILPNVVAAFFIGSLPLIVSNLKPDSNSPAVLTALGPLGGVVALSSGVATALYGYYLKAKSLLPGIAGQIFAMVGSLVFLSGLLLFSFVVAGQIFVFNASAGAQTNGVIAAFLSFVLVAFAIGLFGSINTTGLHRFYRDRLMETFLPMTDAVSKGSAQESDAADNFSIVDVAEGSGAADRPYHLINTNAILVNDGDPKIALRGGDNFLISSAFVGSATTGWMRTWQYVRQHGALTLASAMAVSGAAANANAGYIGTGVTRDRFVSAVMSILNIRLGLWVGNPKVTARSVVPASSAEHDRVLGKLRAKVATYFRPGLTAGIFGFGHHREATFLELSDGGHFENLGLYELIRRRLDLILVVDAEQDSNMSLAALVSSTNRIKEDFGVLVGFLDSRGPEQLIGKDSDRYPSGARLAKSPFVVAEIHYPALPEIPGTRAPQPGKSGVLIYIKSTMVAGLTFATDGYKASNPDFPHQSTADPFFNPDQFEAYRDLGKKSCAAMIAALGLDANVTSAEGLLARYGFPSREAPSSRMSIADRDHRS